MREGLAVERAFTTMSMSGRPLWMRLAIFVVLTAPVVAVALAPPFQFKPYTLVAPVVLASWLFGFSGGFSVSAVGLPAYSVAYMYLGHEGFALLRTPEFLNASILIVVLGAVLGGLRDVNEQMRADYAARKAVERSRDETEQRYRIVAESASDAIFTLDEGGRIQFANPAAVKIFKYDADELEGRPFTLLVPEDERQSQGSTLTQVFDGLIEGESQPTMELSGMAREGRKIDMELSFGAQRAGQHHVFTAIGRDVTDRRLVQQMLKEAKDEADRANRAKSEFLSRMSHELRTPLNAILGFGQLLEMDPLETEQRDSVDQIIKAGRHLLQLVDEILDIARIEAGKLALSMEPVDVKQVLDETWDLLRPRTAQRGIRREDDGTGTSRLVHADRQRLKQVLLNLVSNAVKYAPEGGVIRLGAEERVPGRLRVTVMNSGPGIDPDKRERLFTPFERLGAEQRGIEGTGIGLALSKSLVEAMAGTIGVESEEDEGVTFWLELAIDAWDAQRDTEPVAQESELRDARHTVLYIEDSPKSFDLVRRLLGRRPSVKLLSAELQGGFGIEIASEHRPNVILLDLNLPDMTPDEVLGRLRADPALAKVPVVVMGHDASDSERERLLTKGAAAYLPKPLDVEQFLRTIDQNMAAPT